MSDIPKTFEEAFDGKLSDIVEKLNVRDGLLDLLRDHKLINRCQNETLESLTGCKCSRALLNELSKADDTKVPQFLEDLVKSNQEHIVKIILNRDLLPGEFCPGSSEEHVSMLSKFYGTLVDQLNAESVASQMFQSGALTMSQLVEIQSCQPEYRAAETLLKILLKSPRIVFDRFMDALRETDQWYIHEQIQDGVVPRESKHCELIRKHYVFLVETMGSCYEITSELFAVGVLSVREKQDVEAELTSTRQNQKLMLILNRKPPEQWELFLTALDNHRYTIILDMIT